MKSVLQLLFWKSESKIKSVVQVAYILTVYADVMSKFVYREKRTNVKKMTSKEDKILIKILQQGKRYGMKRLFAEFPDKHYIGHSLTTYCEASAAEDR